MKMRPAKRRERKSPDARQRAPDEKAENNRIKRNKQNKQRGEEAACRTGSSASSSFFVFQQKTEKPRRRAVFRHASGVFCEAAFVFCFPFIIILHILFILPLPGGGTAPGYLRLTVRVRSSAGRFFFSFMIASSLPDDPKDESCSHPCEISAKIQSYVAQLSGTS